MFEVASFGLDAGCQLNLPLVDGYINDALLHPPQVLLEVVDILWRHSVDSLLHQEVEIHSGSHPHK